ncbi:GIY-YIG nuclease family protein [Salinimicrobium catena]|uniref:GIY-YIG nuclease family protein n=1 Tax=Salinimicrobium catena TaxID=390640 RepID=UPI002FE4DA09
MHYLYIIYSPSADKFYTGETNNVPARLKLHNSHKLVKAFTKAASDWELKLIFKTNTKEESLYLERFVKKMKSRKFIEKVIEDPEILNDILKYK